MKKTRMIYSQSDNFGNSVLSDKDKGLTIISIIFESTVLIVYLCFKIFSHRLPLKKPIQIILISSKKAKFVGVSRGYTDYHQGRAIHMANSRIH